MNKEQYILYLKIDIYVVLERTDDNDKYFAQYLLLKILRYINVLKIYMNISLESIQKVLKNENSMF